MKPSPARAGPAPTAPRSPSSAHSGSDKADAAGPPALKTEPTTPATPKVSPPSPATSKAAPAAPAASLAASGPVAPSPVRSRSATLPLILDRGPAGAASGAPRPYAGGAAERAAPAAERTAAPAAERAAPAAERTAAPAGVGPVERSPADRGGDAHAAAADRAGQDAVAGERTGAPVAPPPLPLEGAANGSKVSDEDATVVARSPMAKSADAGGSPLASPHAPSGDELRSQVRAIVEDAIGPWQRASQNQQRTIVELLQRLQELERRIQPVGRAAVGAGLPNLAPASMPPFAVAEPVGAGFGNATPAPLAPAPSAATIDLSSVDQRVIAALEGRSRRRHLIFTAVLVVVLLFGGLGIALALSYMPHSR